VPTTCVAGDDIVYYNGAWTCSPSGLPRYVVNGDGTLTDHQTGLMWEQQTTTCGGEITCVYGIFSWSATGTAADGTLFTQFLATLNGGDYYSPSAGQDVSSGPTACFANHCDWRIPTIAELNTIVALSVPGCGSGSSCIDPAFGATQPSAYHSSSALAGTPNDSWVVNFGYGNAAGASKSNSFDKFYARAVRGVR
jgi:hypothetical protein